MYIVLTDQDEIGLAQQNLVRTVRREFRQNRTKHIRWPRGRFADEQLHSDGTYWFWNRPHDDAPIPRHLNWFGFLGEERHVDITVEVNVPFEGHQPSVGGYFVRDTRENQIYLAHSGKIGGGKTGVGKEAFFAWSNPELIEAVDIKGRTRNGVLVLPLDRAAATRSAINYIETVAHFKQAVKNRELETPDFQSKLQKFRDYYPEPRGRRSGRRARDFDYISRHGEVVDALVRWRTALGLPRKSSVVKNVLVDLGITVDEKLRELFEVKTSTSRSNIYSAIGQLLVHSAQNNCKKTLVIPGEEPLQVDIQNALDALKIRIVTYRLTAEEVIIE